MCDIFNIISKGFEIQQTIYNAKYTLFDHNRKIHCGLFYSIKEAAVWANLPREKLNQSLVY